MCENKEIKTIEKWKIVPLEGMIRKIIGENGTTVCTCANCDSHLIASAPVLLGFLEQSVANEKRMLYECGVTENEWTKEAEKIIAEAKGEIV